MEDLNSTLDGMKKQYREIFLKTVDAIQGRIDELKPLNFKGDIFDTFEEDSIGQQWQNSVIEMFDNDISQEIFRKWTEIIDYRAKTKLYSTYVLGIKDVIYPDGKFIKKEQITI